MDIKIEEIKPEIISRERLKQAVAKIGKKRLTQREIKTFQYMSQGMSRRAAMIKAGYSVTTATHSSTRFMNRPKIAAVLADIADELDNVGITKGFIAGKFKEWLNAEKIHGSLTEPDRVVPDYQTQLKAFNEYKDLIKTEQANKGLGSGVKRKLTVEEFWGEENPDE
jgi:hypothetical protein